MKTWLRWVLTVCALALSQGVWAQISCNVDGSTNLDLNFGTHTLGSAAIDATSGGSMTFVCKNNASATRYAAYCVFLANGTGGAVLGQRLLKSGNNSVQYQLYKDVNRTQVFGNAANTAATGVLIIPSGQTVTEQVATLYGRVVGGQTQAAQGNYVSVFNSSHVVIRWADNGGFFLPLFCNLPNTMSYSGFTVSLRVGSACEMQVPTPLNFGTQNAPLATNASAQTTLSVKCSSGAKYTVSANNGQNAAGNTRRMRLGSTNNRIIYEIYRDANYAGRWGTPGSQRFSGTGTGNFQPHTVYGRVLAAQNPNVGTPGEYKDTVVVTLSY